MVKIPIPRILEKKLNFGFEKRLKGMYFNFH
jgi:hypothetical protein